MAHGRATARSAWRSAPGARCRRRPPGSPSPLGGVIRDVVSGLAATGRARPGADRPGHRLRRRLPASRSRCCSPPWSPSARSCAPSSEPRQPTVIEFRPCRASAAEPRCDGGSRDAHGRHHRLHRRRPGRPLRLLDLLRRPDLLPPPRGQARRLPARIRPCRPGSRSRASRRCPSPKTFLLPHGGTVLGPARRTPTTREINAPSPSAPGRRTAAADRQPDARRRRPRLLRRCAPTCPT